MTQLAEVGCTNTTAVPCFLDHVSWLNETLAGITTKWKFVAGHHPIDAENMKLMEPALKVRVARSFAAGPRALSLTLPRNPSLQAHGVQAYFAGHVHNLQHAVGKDGVNYFISGAGAFVHGRRLGAAGDAAVGSGTTHRSRPLTHPRGEVWEASWLGDGPGFLSVDINGTLTTARFYVNASVVYEVNITA